MFPYLEEDFTAQNSHVGCSVCPIGVAISVFGEMSNFLFTPFLVQGLREAESGSSPDKVGEGNI